ncbi:MAG: N-acetylglucosaminyldiphosphoundecaprenol N-acetyl-beta-D-mannosaminyltransferase [Chloroflexota bacterium]|nr:N-acetylglucosaminyldiphosphoundecaprenol N-acetyl-beta-D-mannosaminyltransferase [Chloroflexota bacterium]
MGRPGATAPRVNILGVGFDRVALVDAVAEIERRLDRGERTFVITANPEFVMLCRQDPEVADIAARADLVVPDGTGAVVAARLLGDPLPGRAPGRLLVDRLAALATDRGLSMFLLGATPGVAERAAARLRARHPDLRIAGTYPGSAEDDDDVVPRLAAAAPDIVLVAFGMPKQERWIARNLGSLPSVRLAVGVGGSLDYLAGTATPPPALVHAIGLEWLWRLARDPKRWRRQRVLPLFVLLVLLARLRRA